MNKVLSNFKLSVISIVAFCVTSVIEFLSFFLKKISASRITGCIFLLKGIYYFWIGRNPYTKTTLPLGMLLVNILLMSTARSLADIIWAGFHPVLFLFGIILWFFYIQALIFSYGFLIIIIAKVLGIRFKLNEKKTIFEMSSYIFWVIPIVPLFSVFSLEKKLQLGIFTRVEWFRYIPTFMVNNNYLPLGMLVFIPILVYKTITYLKLGSKIDFLRSSLIALLSLFVIYVVYYQYTWNLMVFVYFKKGGHFGGFPALLYMYVSYIFECQIISSLMSYPLYRIYKTYPLKTYLIFTLVPLIFFLLLPYYGFLSIWFL